MRIRFKLMVLLLSIALVPLGIVQLSVRSDMTELGDLLAERSANTLVHKASTGLGRIVKDHAKVLGRERQLLESASLLLASKLEGILYGHSHTDPEQGLPRQEVLQEEIGTQYSPPEQARMRSAQLSVDFSRMRMESAPTDTTALLPEHQLEAIAALFGRIKSDYPQLVLWVTMQLSDGSSYVYPSYEFSGMRARMMSRMWQGGGSRRGHMAGAGQNDSVSLQDGLKWSPAKVDPLTRRMAFSITSPIRDTEGKLVGNLSLSVPITSLLGQKHKISMFTDNSEALLVRPGADKSTNSDGLRVIAGESEADQGMRHWMVPEEERFLSRPGKQAFLAMLDDIRSGEAGVAGISDDEGDALWAYAPVDPSGTALLLIVPKKDVVQDAEVARQFVHAQVDEQTNKMGLIFLAVAALVFLLAYVLSRLFTHNIKKLAHAVRSVAHGDFNVRVPVHSSDEIGQLSHAFNRMVPELRERVAIKNALEVAQQVQQDLLPAQAPSLPGYDIAATSIYCDETGGDYYGFMERGENGGQLMVAVGDVTGHGIPAALMMASVRAYLRSSVASAVPLDQVVSNINRLVSEDVDQTGRFMTLFLLEIDDDRSIRWVRAGHDPAMLYDPATDEFSELEGEGLPLGVTDVAEFRAEQSSLAEGMTLVIATDGIWETTSPEGQMFGKDRVKTLIRENSSSSSQELQEIILSTVAEFRGENSQDDDLTLVVIKTSTRVDLM